MAWSIRPAVGERKDPALALANVAPAAQTVHDASGWCRGVPSSSVLT